MHQLISVPFHQDNLVLINHNDEPFVAMKPIVVQMGLIWAAQYVKIMEKFESVVSIIETTGEDGKIYKMICLPLKKLPAWLYSISPNKVNPEIKDKIIQYQDECDDVLWQYWTKGFVENPRNKSGNQQVQMGTYRLKLAAMLETERHPVKREMIYQQLQSASDALGLPTPEKDSLGKTGKKDALLVEFWDYYNENPQINVSRDPAIIALNITNFLTNFQTYAQQSISRVELRRVLETSEEPKYLGYKNVNSKHDGKILRCLTFENLQ